MSDPRHLSVAIVGAGPAGIYAADILSKSGLDVSIDIFERLPAPYGLVRYGVAPDHPRIKQIIVALFRILQRGDIRLIGNVEVGRDIPVSQLTERYDAVILATGSDRDAPINLPGTDLPEVHGASEFVFWYDGHPEAPRTWPLEAKEVAVLGVGNVALDVARMLTKHVEDLMPTEIPANVAEVLRSSPVTDVHLFGRRGPAQVKFSPLELREMGQMRDVDVIVHEEDFDFDEGSEAAIRSSNQTKQVVKTLVDWTLKDPEDRRASRRIHLHFFHKPVAVLGRGGHVVGIRTERTQLVGDGTVRATGEYVDTPVGAVYRAVGYFSSPVEGVPFDDVRGVIPNSEGRVLDEHDQPIRGLYATGWVKRGPVGLIGSTKSDAQQTIAHLVEDAHAGRLDRDRDQDALGHDAMVADLEAAGIRFTTWQGWELLDAYERALGADEGRDRVKVVERETMIAISRDEGHVATLP
ncbi:MAG TPA: FAD-dependent oxidoreductase [Demequina sp.]|nr:FAD-dependent oxidoreductase [Demequina sp.]